MTNHDTMSEQELLAEIDRIAVMLTTPGALQNDVLADPEAGQELRALTRQALHMTVDLVVDPGTPEEADDLLAKMAEQIALTNLHIYKHAARKLAELGSCMLRVDPTHYMDFEPDGVSEDEIAEATQRAIESGFEMPEGGRIGASRPKGKLNELVDFAAAMAGGPEEFEKFQIAAMKAIPEEHVGTPMALVMMIVGSVTGALHTRMFLQDTIKSTISGVMRAVEVSRNFTTAPTIASTLPVSELIVHMSKAFPELIQSEPDVAMGERQAPKPLHSADIIPFPKSATVH